MKKKILNVISIILLVLMLFILTGCGNEKTNNNESNPKQEIQQEQKAKETNLIPRYDQEKHLYGYVDENENWVIEAKFEKVEEFSNGYARVLLSRRKYTFIDQKGVQITSDVFYSADDFSTNGFALVQKEEDGNYGYINSKGTLVIDYKYSKAESFSTNGLALVKENENSKYGYINDKGEYSIQAVYDEAQSFTNDGYAGAMLNGTVGVIDKDGNFLFETTNYNFAWAMENTNLVKVGQGVAYWKIKGTNHGLGGTLGITDLKGNVITELKYLSIDDYINNYAVVKDKNNKYGLIDNNGQEVIECKYDTLKYNEDEKLYAVTVGEEKYYINTSDERIKDW